MFRRLRARRDPVQPARQTTMSPAKIIHCQFPSVFVSLEPAQFPSSSPSGGLSIADGRRSDRPKHRSDYSAFGLTVNGNGAERGKAVRDSHFLMWRRAARPLLRRPDTWRGAGDAPAGNAAVMTAPRRMLHMHYVNSPEMNRANTHSGAASRARES